MHPTTIRRAVRLAANVTSAIAAHEFGDQFMQGGGDAITKGQPGHQGRAACLRHVVSYTATHAAGQIALHRAIGIQTRPGVFVLGHAATGVLHYVMDRSRDSGRLIDVLDNTAGRVGLLPSKREYWNRGGQPALDQAWHWACLMAWAVTDAVAAER